MTKDYGELKGEAVDRWLENFDESKRNSFVIIQIATYLLTYDIDHEILTGTERKLRPAKIERNLEIN